MITIADVCKFLDSIAPLELAEEWDNVGLLVGDPSRVAKRMMTCLTITPESAGEAIDKQADLIITHHPLPFVSTKRITVERTPTRLLWELAGAGISIYSAHTAFDSAEQGINAQLSSLLGLDSVRPLNPRSENANLGSGRVGTIENSDVGTLASRLKSELKLTSVKSSHSSECPVHRVAVACGSGGSFIGCAHRAECDCLVTGEASFHDILEARANGIALILVGHFASERFAIERLAESLRIQFADANIWPSRLETDPLQTI